MRPALALALLTFAACAGDASPSGPDAGGDPLLAPPPAGAGRQLALDVHVDPGQEMQRCQYIVIDDAMAIGRFEHAYSTGSHHLLVYQTDLDPAAAPTDVFDCTHQQLSDLGVSGIAYGAQVATGELAYPDGVALKVPAHSVLLLQTHYLNASDKPLDAHVRVNIWYATGTITQEASTLFFYDWAIVVPQGQPAHAHMQCAIPGDIHLIFGVSHMHKRGVGYTATLDPDTELFSTDRWENVEPRLYAPAQPISAGSMIDFQCDYQGDADRTVVQGPSADANEMCMFIASYYPKLDETTELCQGAGTSGPRFDGSATCNQTVDCYRAATDPVAKQQCLVATCAASSQPADDLFMCMNQNCASDCALVGNACNACVSAHCGDAYQACAQATCQ